MSKPIDKNCERIIQCTVDEFRRYDREDQLVMLISVMIGLDLTERVERYLHLLETKETIQAISLEIKASIEPPQKQQPQDTCHD